MGLLSGCGHMAPPDSSTKSDGSVSSQNLAKENRAATLPEDPVEAAPGSVPAFEYPQLDAPESASRQASDDEAEDDAGDIADKEEQSLLDEALGFCELAQSFWQKGELDNALESLDKAYSLILGVDTLENAKLIQQKEDLRFLISKRILEIHASRNIVVNGNHDEIPMVMNSHVEKELKLFTGPERKFFVESYKRSGQYRDYILGALRKAGLPEELSWLPLIESGFKVRAFSRARALGLWQFIPSTGYKFGLKRNKYIDERFDFIKSTDAAIAYLQELHSIFGDWATVLAGYNCGEGRVLKVIRSQKVNYLDNFWDLYQRLPRETARYVPRFFATLHIVKNPGKYGFDDLSAGAPPRFETLEINRQVHLKYIAEAIGSDLETLRALNPELRYNIVPPEPYKLRVPHGRKENLRTAIKTIPVAKLPQRAYVWHRVRYGQNLSAIARRYRTSVSAIMRANNLRRRNMIRAGKRLKIPLRGYKTSKSVAVQRPTAPRRTTGLHYVRKGDSLWIIAKRYGTTVKKIKKANGLYSNRLAIGQRLKVPGVKREPLPDTSRLNTYRVQRGDSPYTIARKHQIQLERLLRINRLTPRSKIFPGQKLFVE